MKLFTIDSKKLLFLHIATSINTEVISNELRISSRDIRNISNQMYFGLRSYGYLNLKHLRIRDSRVMDIVRKLAVATVAVTFIVQKRVYRCLSN